MGKLGNHRRVFLGNDLGAAVILDFRSRLANRCSGEKFRLQRPLRQRGPRPILIFVVAKEIRFVKRKNPDSSSALTSERGTPGTAIQIYEEFEI